MKIDREATDDMFAKHNHKLFGSACRAIRRESTINCT